ncbi:MAG: efflux RND transporter permease subunit, partial [Bdellovibrionota bacterium]
MIEAFIRKGVFTLSINLLILLAGYFTLPYIANEFIPSIEIPAVAVIIPSPMMPKDKIAHQVVAPLERSFMQTGEITSVEGVIEDGKAIIIVFYKWDFSPEEALRKARQIVDNAVRVPGTLDPIFILHRPSNNPIFRVALYGDSILDISENARLIAPEIERIAGVAQVIISGDVAKEMVAEVRPEEMARAGINSGDIVKSAKEFWNLNLFLKGDTYNHLLTNNIHSEAQLANLPVVSMQTKKKVPLGHFATIKNNEGTIKVLMNGDSPAVIIEALKGAGADTLSIVDRIQNILSKFNNIKGLKQKIIYNEADKIREGQDSVLSNFYAGLALNSLILMIFLGSPIGVLVASVIFPTSLIGSLIAMKFFGISLNLFSLNGFSLAVGMITDASTVILESVIRRVQSGLDLYKACVRGVKDVSIGIVSSTLSSAGVLLPIAMQKNITSKLFSDLALTVVSTQILSLIAVFSLVPWLCYKVLGRKSRPNRFSEIIFSVGPTIVDFSVKYSQKLQAYCRLRPKRQLLASLITTGLCLGMLAFMPKTEFLPMVSSRVYSLDYPIDRREFETVSDNAMKTVAKTLSSWSDSNWAITKKGVNGIEALFELKNSLPLKDLEQRLDTIALKRERLHILPVGPAPTGESMGYDGLIFVSEELSAKQRHEFITSLCQAGKIAECLTDDFYSMTESELQPKHILTHAIGSNEIESLAQMVIPLNKIDLSNLGRFNIDQPVNLSVKVSEELLNLPLHVKQTGTAILKDLYDFTFGKTQSLLNRLNNESFSALYFKLKNATLGEIDLQITDISKKLGIPSGKISPRGGMETMNESFANLIAALCLSALIVFTILLLQFRSFTQS